MSSQLYIGNSSATPSIVVEKPVPMPYSIQKVVDANGKIVNGTTIPDLVGATDVGDSVFRFQYCDVVFPNNTDIDFSPLVTISGREAFTSSFQGTKGINSVDFSSLTAVSAPYALNYAFYGSDVTSIDFSSLTTVSGMYSLAYICSYCTGIISLSFDSLTVLSGSSPFNYSFSYCRNLTNIYFPSITSTSFGGTKALNNIIFSVTGCTIHFPSNLDPQSGSTVISSLDRYPNFDGTNTILAFDLPATVTLTGADSVTYTRNPKYDTVTALAWKVGAYGTTNFTPAYYTSGTTDPVTSDTIYSDVACTTAVTTISSIS